MIKKVTLVKMLREFANSLTDESRELARRVQDVITEAEGSEEDVEGDELSDRIQRVLNERAEEFANSAAIENRVRQIINDIKGESKKQTSFIQSKEAVRAFRDAIMNSMNGNMFHENWKGVLVKNGISGLVFPEVVMDGIANPWASENGLLGRIRKVSDQEFKIPYTTDDDFTYSSSAFTKETLAVGHAKGTQKQEQIFEVTSKKIEMQGIYKYIKIDRVDLAKMANDEAFIRFIVEELNQRLAYTIERTIIAGNPFASIGGGTNNYNISKFESIGTKTSADAWTKVKNLSYANATAVGTLLPALYELAWSLKDYNQERWLYIAPNLLSVLANRATSSTSPFVVGLDAIANELGVSRVIPYAPLAVPTSGTGTTGGAVFITPNQYFRVGGEAFGEQWSIYEYNQEAFMAEVFAGGAVGGVASTGVLTVTRS